MRKLFTLLHRWVGLATATFLFIAGATGAIISWDEELDGLLNPDLHETASRGPQRPALDLAALVEARDPHVQVTYLKLEAKPRETLSILVQPRGDTTTGAPYRVDYNQVFIDPVTGAETGRREWGAVWPVTQRTLISFLYKLHYSLHVPRLWGEERWGIWLMGSVALAWTLDCFVGLYLTFPLRHTRKERRPAEAVERRSWFARWKPAWLIKTSGSAYRVTFDIHRAASLWTFALLLVIAFTAFSLNLYREVFFPAMSTISKVTPTPFDQRTPRDAAHTIALKLGRETILETARTEATRRGWREPPGAFAYDPRYGIAGVLFFPAGGEDAHGGALPATLFYDAEDGRLLGDKRPWTGTVADIFVQAQFPVHSGRILGVPGRILMSCMGLVVATLSITGVLIWWRKRAGRVARRRKGRASSLLGGDGLASTRP